MEIDWTNVKCPKCSGKKFFGKYTDEPYCLDCGTFFNIYKTKKQPKEENKK